MVKHTIELTAKLVERNLDVFTLRIASPKDLPIHESNQNVATRPEHKSQNANGSNWVSSWGLCV